MAKRDAPTKGNPSQVVAADPAALLAELRESQSAVAGDVAAFGASVGSLKKTLEEAQKAVTDLNAAKSGLEFDLALSRGVQAALESLLESVLKVLGIATADNPAFQAPPRIMPTED